MIGLWIGLAWVIFGGLAGLIRHVRDTRQIENRFRDKIYDDNLKAVELVKEYHRKNAGQPGYNRGWVASAELEIYKHEWFNSTLHSLEECDMRPGREGWLRRETAEYNVRPKVQVVFNPLTTDAILISPLGTVEL